MRIGIVCLLFVLACGGPPASRPAEPAPPPPAPAADAGVVPQHGWQVAFREDFESSTMPQGAWSPDPVPDDGPFADNGSFFKAQGVVPPKAFRTSVPFGDQNWLTAESYTRNDQRPFGDLLSIVPDPSGAPGHVLKLASPAHTDAT